MNGQRRGAGARRRRNPTTVRRQRRCPKIYCFTSNTSSSTRGTTTNKRTLKRMDCIESNGIEWDRTERSPIESHPNEKKRARTIMTLYCFEKWRDHVLTTMCSQVLQCIVPTCSPWVSIPRCSSDATASHARRCRMPRSTFGHATGCDGAPVNQPTNQPTNESEMRKRKPGTQASCVRAP